MKTAEELNNNYQSLIKVIDETFQGERKDNLKKLYTFLEERIILAPASGIEYFHNAWPGGYIDHILRVIACAKQVKDIWASMGANINFTDEELIFSALNHDLGKLGDLDGEYYTYNESEWHRDKMGIIYNTSENIINMPVPHRSLFMLQQFNIKVTQNEYIAIMTHDGVYSEGNIEYLKTYKKEKVLKTCLPIILHHADHMASRIEYENREIKKDNKNNNYKKNKTTISQSNKSINANKLFSDLFEVNK